MSRNLRIAIAFVVVAVIVVVFVVPILFAKHDRTPAAPTPTPGIVARARDIRAVPRVTDGRRHAAVDEIAVLLDTLYTKAFIKDFAADVPSPSPTAANSLATSIRPFMTEAADSAVASSPGVFDIGGDLSVTDGSLTFSGLITFGDKDPIGADLRIDFVAHAAPIAGTPVANVHQRGTCVLKHTAAGWFVDGFDLTFATNPAPTPTPT